ncbi:unnamed protein product, partial [Closterium sp. NIES-54]
NTVSCNYVIGGDHCYYLDYCTSGVAIQGGVCLQLWDGVKLNNGKRNHIRSLLMVGLGQSPGYITCFTVTVNHCRKDPGSYWEAMRKLYYDTPEINKEWPWMKHVCRQTRIGAYSCNPPGPNALTAHDTGACSGMATENDVEYIVVDPDTLRDAEYRYCELNPGADYLNRQIVFRYTGDDMKFADYANQDFGVSEGSVVLAEHPDFVSCPKKDIGIKAVSVQSYFKDWNIPEPPFFQAMLDLPYKMVFNTCSRCTLPSTGLPASTPSAIFPFLPFLPFLPAPAFPLCCVLCSSVPAASSAAPPVPDPCLPASAATSASLPAPYSTSAFSSPPSPFLVSTPDPPSFPLSTFSLFPSPPPSPSPPPPFSHSSRTACTAASCASASKACRSVPLNPSVHRASSARSTSAPRGSVLESARRIASRSSSLGKSQSTSRSNCPGCSRAGSIRSKWLVAATKKNPFYPFNSIHLR